MNRAGRTWLVAGVAAVLLAGCSSRSAQAPETFAQASRPADVFPDYNGCVIPPNIAPLNFVINEPGQAFRARARATGADGRSLVVNAPSGKVVWPLKDWRDLLAGSGDRSVTIDVFVRDRSGQWTRFDPMTNWVADDPIDPYVAYRLLGPMHNVHLEMGVYQRCLENFEQTPILVSDRQTDTCVNCHSFVNNRPETMSLHLRGSKGLAMLVARDGQVEKLDTRTAYNASPAAYTSWHPSGRAVAFSVNRPELWHRTTGQSRAVIDRDSNLAIYDLAADRIRSTGDLADPDYLETFPAWSPDGKHLYFCRARRTWDLDAPQPHRDYQAGPSLPPDYEQLQYDLVRVGYDIETGRWGPMETVLAAKTLGRSICEPRVSPDGRFVLFTAVGYGTFPVYNEDADLFMLDLDSGQAWPIEANSARSESWHAFSSNGRWIVFASKRRDGLFGKLYFSYVDAEGRTRKPFLLPQEDPAFYDSFLKTFNAPEFITGKVTVSADQLHRAAEAEQMRRIDAASGATAKAPPAAGD